MSLRVAVSVLIGMLTFVALQYQPGHAQAGLAVTVTAEAVGITISGGGEYDFGGPWGPGLSLKAHPQSSAGNVVGAPPTITNTGNVAITYIEVAYDGASGQEAICDSGAGNWEAHASTVGQDRFVMRAWASTNTTWTNFNTNALALVPGVGTGNILPLTNSPVTVNQSIPLLLELKTPDPIVSGGQGCTISLSVTASAE